MLLATRSVFDAVGRCVVQREFGTSDHAPVFAEYTIGAAVAPPEVKLSTPAAVPPADLQGSLF